MTAVDFMEAVRATFPECRWDNPLRIGGNLVTYSHNTAGVSTGAIYYEVEPGVWHLRLHGKECTIKASSVEELRTAYELELARYS